MSTNIKTNNDMDQAYINRKYTNRGIMDKDNQETVSATTLADHSGRYSDQSCVVYKFHSRPPYEGFVLILIIVVIAIVLIWWLNSKLQASEQ